MNIWFSKLNKFNTTNRSIIKPNNHNIDVADGPFQSNSFIFRVCSQFLKSAYIRFLVWNGQKGDDARIVNVDDDKGEETPGQGDTKNWTVSWFLVNSLQNIKVMFKYSNCAWNCSSWKCPYLPRIKLKANTSKYHQTFAGPLVLCHQQELNVILVY